MKRHPLCKEPSLFPFTARLLVIATPHPARAVAKFVDSCRL